MLYKTVHLSWIWSAVSTEAIKSAMFNRKYIIVHKFYTKHYFNTAEIYLYILCFAIFKLNLNLAYCINFALLPGYMKKFCFWSSGLCVHYGKMFLVVKHMIMIIGTWYMRVWLGRHTLYPTCWCQLLMTCRRSEGAEISHSAWGVQLFFFLCISQNSSY